MIDTRCIYANFFFFFLQNLVYERYFLKFFVPKNVSYFVQKNRIDMFKENTIGHFDAKVYSNIF